MPLLLFWYILRDLLKVLAISTAVLVTIISFGAAIKPLSDGTLGPVALLKYILLAMPPMLQFALPFSAAFSATMVYHRMTSDNEISACAASGVSYPQLLLPAATLGVVLTIALSLISNYVSPAFWEAMARTSTRSVAEVVVGRISRGEPVQTDTLTLYARQALRIPVPEGVDADAAIGLDRVLAVNMRRGEVISTQTARQCIIYLKHTGSMTVITPIMDQGRMFQIKDEGAQVRVSASAALLPELVVEDEIERSPRFMDVGRLKAVHRAPETYSRVAQKIDELRRWMTQRELFHLIDQRLRETGTMRFSTTRLGQDNQPVAAQVELAAGGLVAGDESWTVLPPAGGGLVRLTITEGIKRTVALESRQVRLRPRIRLLPEEPTLDAEFSQVTQIALDTSPNRSRQFEQQTVPYLRVEAPIVRELQNQPARELVKAAQKYGDDATLRRLDTAIRTEVSRLLRSIVARIHERAAMSVSCLVMMLLGSVLAISMRNALPLTVYFWSFIPAILGLVVISSGADVVNDVSQFKHADVVGLVVMWSGNLLMAAMSLAFLRRVMRN
ncbi:MAG: LptF/LptG family permease [Phycisphaerales bacterium]|nr:LptF/LptG family permease [Phycisphaerales bacterium]